MNSHARRCTLKLIEAQLFSYIHLLQLVFKNLHNNFFFLFFFLSLSLVTFFFFLSFFLLLFLFEWYLGLHWLRHLCTRHPRNTRNLVISYLRLYFVTDYIWIYSTLQCFLSFCWLFYKCSGLTFYEVFVELWTSELNVLVIDSMYHSESFYGVYSSI